MTSDFKPGIFSFSVTTELFESANLETKNDRSFIETNDSGSTQPTKVESDLSPTLKKCYMTNLETLINTLPQIGEVVWIGLRPGKKAAIKTVTSVFANDQTGLVGDRYAGRSGERQVTLMQAEHLAVISCCLDLETVDPELFRRNILVKGINLLALKNKKFSIGQATLEMTGLCCPCSFMEETLGPGGYNAMRGHGGITARVINNGEISLLDKVCYQQG